MRVVSARDPISEARRALRDLLDGAMFADRDEARAVLARLDALPAPQRITTWSHEGWYYLDAPVARDDGGDDAV